jgi:hypothetical protein
VALSVVASFGWIVSGSASSTTVIEPLAGPLAPAAAGLAAGAAAGAAALAAGAAAGAVALAAGAAVGALGAWGWAGVQASSRPATMVTGTMARETLQRDRRAGVVRALAVKLRILIDSPSS